MKKQSRLSYIAIASSILLPYGFVMTYTPIFRTNLYWLFPLWTYFGTLEYGRFGGPFSPSFSLILPQLGLIWCVAGLYVSRALHQLYAGQRDAKSVWIPTISILILQVVVTYIVSFFVWDFFFLAPLPLHFLIVLFLLLIQVQRVTRNKYASEVGISHDKIQLDSKRSGVRVNDKTP